MNPEEGDLRPQLLDRFGMCVDVEGIRDVGRRVEIVERREEYEEDPEAFASRFEPSEREEAQRISTAMTTLSDVVVDRDILLSIAELSIELDVDGHRADIVMRKSAQALAALEDRAKVEIEDVEHVAPMVLAHRVKPAAHGGGRRAMDEIGEVLRRPHGAADGH